MPTGIDISNHQGSVNAAAMKADGVEFVWAKASEGTDFIDKFFIQNQNAFRSQGIPVGPYHYGRPDENGPVEEADYFCRVIGKPREGDLIPMLDIEVAEHLTATQLSDWINRFCARVKENTGSECGFYTYPYYLKGQISKVRLKRGLKLWYADYTGVGGKYRYLSFVHGLKVVAQQYTSRGRIGGRFPIDLNYAPELFSISQTPREPKPNPKPTRRMPGPVKKPRWLWAYLKAYLANRRKNT